MNRGFPKAVGVLLLVAVVLILAVVLGSMDDESEESYPSEQLIPVLIGTS